MDAVLAFMKRANDVYHVKCFVQLTRKEYAELRALTAAHDTYRRDFDDEDGVCTFELRDGDLYLRTADGELKAVMDEDALKQRESASADGLTKVVMTPTSPVGRFGQYCRSAGLDAEHYMHFQKVLKNEALLDSIVAAKGQQRKAAFVYVAQMPAGAATEADAVRTVSAPLACCAGSFEVHVALVRRKGVDIGCVIKRLRHARIDKTLQLLQQPGLTDALVARVAPARGGGAAASAAATAATPRARFLAYASTCGVSLADATAFADAMHSESRLDAVVLLKDRDGVTFNLLIQTLNEPDGGEALAEHIMRKLPERLRAAMCMGFMTRDADLHAEVARLRLVDPFRVRAMLAKMPDVMEPVMTFGHQPLQSATEADRVCAACGLRVLPAPAQPLGSAPTEEARTLRACGACRLTLYCSAECQKGHWPEHKKACKAAREAVSGAK
jgi:hypothetical protein